MPEPQSSNNDLPVKAPASAEDIVDLFGDTDDDKQVKESKSEKSKELPDDSEEIELKESEEDEEVLDLNSEDADEVRIDAPPRKKEILAKFPELFKTFPFLEKVLYRDREYSELFGSFDDAKEIAERYEGLTQVESQLLSGDTTEVLKNVKDTDPKAFDKIVDNYLQSLAKVDKDAYFDVVNSITKKLIYEMVQEAKSSGNEELQQAALLVNQFLFNTSQYVPPKPRTSNSQNEEQSEVERERLDFVRERLETSVNDLQGKVDNTLKATINEYIDPKGVMSGYVKKNAVADTLRAIQTANGSDPNFQKTLDKLWRAATESKFSRESLAKIQSFYLGRAKANLPLAIKKARAEALKDLTPAKKVKAGVEDDEFETEETPRKRNSIAAGRPLQQNRDKAKMQKGETVMDFLSRD